MAWAAAFCWGVDSYLYPTLSEAGRAFGKWQSALAIAEVRFRLPQARTVANNVDNTVRSSGIGKNEPSAVASGQDDRGKRAARAPLMADFLRRITLSMDATAFGFTVDRG